jgi:imidazolonepropionase-like amidohydrolase
VRVAITTDHPGVPIQLLVLQAALAVKAGMDRDAALRAITSVPAEIYGVADRIGSLTVGTDADVVLWSGDPLDVMSRPLLVYLEGRVVYRDAGW